MLITVTWKDIRDGWLFTKNRHPINLAIKRVTGLDSTLNNCSVDILHDDFVDTIDLSDETIRWVAQLERDYDNGRVTDEHEMELIFDECHTAN